MLQLISLGQGNPSGDLETIARDCYRGFDGANQETRKDIAKLLGTLVAYTQHVSYTISCLSFFDRFLVVRIIENRIIDKVQSSYFHCLFQSPSQSVGNASKGGISHMKSAAPTGAQKQSLPLEDALNILLQGFIKGLYSTLYYFEHEKIFNVFP